MKQNRGVILALIVIVIGIVLSLVLLGFFTGQHPYGLKNSSDFVKVSCGLTVKTPVKYQTVKFPFLVTGYTNGCGWEPVNESVGTLTVLGENGTLLAKGAITTTDTLQPNYFEVTVDIPTPNFIKGTFIFENGKTGFESQRVLVPVVFD